MEQNEALSFNPRMLLEHYLAGRYDELSEQFLRILSQLASQSYLAVDQQRRHFLNLFLKHFLYLFTQEDYEIGDKYVNRYIDLNSLIGNIAAMSEFRTTDSYLRILEKQPKNFVKLLTLYNPHNTIRLDRRSFFDTNASLASRWYFSFLENYRSRAASENSYEHLREHLDYFDERLSIGSPFLNASYFGCTYYDLEKEGALKRKINQAVQRDLARVSVENKPDPVKIGVFTSMWFPAQSVYRSQQPFIESLAQDYELTLIHLGPEREDIDTSLFADVRRYEIGSMRNDISSFSPNEFGLAYFPDIGMSNESIFLSNLRIAPIQVSNYGHPVSTYGSRIDYWIGGLGTEVQELAEQNYSERLVLIPGAGQLPVYPKYEPLIKQVPDHPILINCPWAQQKINYPLLCRLREVLERTNQPVKFQMFPGGILRNGYVPLKQDIADLLGEKHVEVHRGLNYQGYMGAMEQGHFSIDSFPFGGYNSIIDSMFLRKPVVAWRGDRFFNRAAAFLLEQVGLEELIADSGEQYVELIVRLINDHVYRREITERLSCVDVDQLVFDLNSSVYFKKAIDHLIQHHDELRNDISRTPIVIE